MKTPIRLAAVLALSIVATACGGGAAVPSASPSSAPRGASTYDEFATEACSAFAAMQRAIGNPDTGEGSALSDQLEAAASAGDADAAAVAAEAVEKELQAGRGHAMAAAAWAPANRMMTAFDRFLAAYQAMVAKELARARGEAGARDSQQVFEAAGGAEAWTQTLEGYQELMASRPSGAAPRDCLGVPVGF